MSSLDFLLCHNLLSNDLLMTVGCIDDPATIVIGGGGHIGSVVAEVLSRSGGTLAVVDIAEDNAKAAAWEIGLAGGDARAITLDVSDEDAVHRTFDEIAAEFGQIDAMVYFAAPLYLIRDERPSIRAGLRQLQRRQSRIHPTSVHAQHRSSGLTVDGGVLMHLPSFADRRSVQPPTSS